MAGRSRNGMGTVVKRSDGRYQAAVYVLTPTGHRSRRFVYGRTWDEANDKRLELLDNNRRGVPSVSSAMPLGEYLDHWLTDVATGQLRPSTFARYRALVEDYITPHLGRKRINRLTTSDVRAFLLTVHRSKGKSGRPLSARTVQFIHAVLRSALQHAVREDLIGRNVARLVTPPKVETPDVVPLDVHDARTFLKVASEHWLAALWLILVTTGLRRGEALGLTWADIDLDRATLHVRRTIQKINGQFLYGEPKSRRSKRAIRLPNGCIAALRRHQRITADRADLVRWSPLPGQPAELVFVTRTGRPIDPRALNKAFGRLLVRAGLSHARVHDLRHTCASLAAPRGSL